MKLFDADILSYVVYDAHIAHAVAWNLFETALHQEIDLYVLPTTILETYNTLFWYYRVRPRRALLEKLGAIINQMNCLPVSEIGILVAKERNIPLGDGFLLATAKSQRIPVILSNDAHIQKQAPAMGLFVENPISDELRKKMEQGGTPDQFEI